MLTLETDYLVIGAGAVGLAFADTLLAESPGATLLVVDRHGLPGGHWNDAYPFVRLHQPSAFYGVASLALGDGALEEEGPDAGFMQLASGAEVLAHFQHAMRRLLASGRVVYRPMSELREGDGRPRLVSLLSGETAEVHVRRRVVDASYYGSRVPSTHRPGFDVHPQAALLAPNALPALWQQPERLPPAQVVVLGGGKTAMDSVVWLLGAGLPPERIGWVRPRESWLIDRRSVQPTMAHFDTVMGAQAALLEALAQAQTVDELFERQEAAGGMLRIDPDTRPTMFHYATISAGELAQLRRVERVWRGRRVRGLEPDALVFDDGREPLPAGTLCVDCTASGVERRPPVPVFQPGRIVLQMLRIPQPTFSAALVARLEAGAYDDPSRNAMARAIPLPDGLDGYPRATLTGLQNQMRWSQDAALRAWIRGCRLDGFGALVAAADRADAVKAALLARIKAAAPGVMAAAPRWLAMAPGR